MTQQIVVGEVAGAFGVNGWVKIYSHTNPPQNILKYKPWLLTCVEGSKEYPVMSGRLHGQFVVAKFEGVNDRDQALKLKSCKITVARESLPPLDKGQYYWSDLIGLRVANLAGVDFGSIVEMLGTGANDVIVAKGERERLIPFIIGQYVMEIKLDEGTLLVDWDAEF